MKVRKIASLLLGLFFALFLASCQRGQAVFLVDSYWAEAFPQALEIWSREWERMAYNAHIVTLESGVSPELEFLDDNLPRSADYVFVSPLYVLNGASLVRELRPQARIVTFFQSHVESDVVILWNRQEVFSELGRRMALLHGEHAPVQASPGLPVEVPSDLIDTEPRALEGIPDPQIAQESDEQQPSDESGQNEGRQEEPPFFDVLFFTGTEVRRQEKRALESAWRETQGDTTGLRIQEFPRVGDAEQIRRGLNGLRLRGASWLGVFLGTANPQVWDSLSDRPEFQVITEWGGQVRDPVWNGFLSLEPDWESLWRNFRSHEGDRPLRIPLPFRILVIRD